MINAILKGIFKLIISLVDLILSPIDLLINSSLPAVATGLNYVSGFFNYILQFIPYLCSWLNLPQIFIDLVIGYWTFKLSVPLVVRTIKLALAWYDKLKP